MSDTPIQRKANHFPDEMTESLRKLREQMGVTAAVERINAAAPDEAKGEPGPLPDSEDALRNAFAPLERVSLEEAQRRYPRLPLISVDALRAEGAAAEREHTVRHLLGEADRLGADGFKASARTLRQFAEDLSRGDLELRGARHDEDVRFEERERIRLELLDAAAKAYPVSAPLPQTWPEWVAVAVADAFLDFARRLETPPVKIPLSNGIAQALAGKDAVRVCSCGTGYDPDCPFHASR